MVLLHDVVCSLPFGLLICNYAPAAALLACIDVVFPLPFVLSLRIIRVILMRNFLQERGRKCKRLLQNKTCRCYRDIHDIALTFFTIATYFLSYYRCLECDSTVAKSGSYFTTKLHDKKDISKALSNETKVSNTESKLEL